MTVLLAALACFRVPAAAAETPLPSPSPALVAEPSPTPEKEPFTYNEYTVSMEVFPETRAVVGTVRVRYKNNTGVPLHKVCFNLLFNAFSEDAALKPYFPSAYSQIFKYGEDYSSFDVVNASVNGAACRYAVSGTWLTVYLPFVLQKEQEVNIELLFEAYVPKISHRAGANNAAVWFGGLIPILAVYDKTEQQWRQELYYPAGKPFFSNIANFTVRVTTPQGYAAAGPGDAVSSLSGDKKITTMTANMVRDFAFAVSSEYRETVSQTASGVYVCMNMFSEIPERSMDYYISTISSALDFFSEKLGAYPYKTLRVAENGNYVNTAVYPQLIFLATGAAQSENLAATAMSLVTGAARQWFYGVVGHDPVKEAWLGEGLSYYAACMFFHRDDPGQERLNEVMNGLYRGLSEDYASLKRVRLSDDISVYDSNAAYAAVQTTKAALMFHALRGKLGSGGFDDFLHLYVHENYLAIATAESLIRAAEEIYGESLADFFGAWLYGEDLPDMTSSN